MTAASPGDGGLTDFVTVAYEIATGPPFTGALDSAGDASIGPLQGVPPLTLYAVALAFTPASSVVPTSHTVPVSYVIP